MCDWLSSEFGRVDITSGKLHFKWTRPWACFNITNIYFDFATGSYHSWYANTDIDICYLENEINIDHSSMKWGGWQNTRPKHSEQVRSEQQSRWVAMSQTSIRMILLKPWLLWEPTKRRLKRRRRRCGCQKDVGADDVVIVHSGGTQTKDGATWLSNCQCTTTYSFAFFLFHSFTLSLFHSFTLSFSYSMQWLSCIQIALLTWLKWIQSASLGGPNPARHFPYFKLTNDQQTVNKPVPVFTANKPKITFWNSIGFIKWPETVTSPAYVSWLN